MFITLTNASPAHKGKTISINSDNIVSIHRGQVTRDDEHATEETITFIFVPPHGTWEVEELPEDIVARLNA